MSKSDTLVWEIKGDNIKSPSYIFGTMHVQDDKAFKNIDFIENLISQSNSFAAEYDLGIEDPESFHQAILLEDGLTLSSLLSSKTYQKLAVLFKKETSLDLADFDRHKPVMVINMLTGAQFANDRHVSLDQHLYDFAKNKGLNLLGIESFDSQVEVLKKMPLKDQLKSLKEMATHFERFRRNIKKTTEIYIEADLQKLLKKVKKTAGSMRSLLLYDRNVIMADRIAALAQENSLFAAIGAGHLAGKKGVLRLLKMKGLQVTPIFY